MIPPSSYIGPCVHQYPCGGAFTRKICCSVKIIHRPQKTCISAVSLQELPAGSNMHGSPTGFPIELFVIYFGLVASLAAEICLHVAYFQSIMTRLTIYRGNKLQKSLLQPLSQDICKF